MGWMRGVWVVVVGLGLTAAGCSGAAQRGECKEYKPLGACSLDFEYVCETTEDGCEQCSCVPRRGLEEGRFGTPYER